MKLNNGLKFIIDLDGTLKTESNFKPLVEADTITVVSGKKTYCFSLRPYTLDLLLAARYKGEVFLGTAGGRGYARRILSATGLDKYFDRVYSVEDFVSGIPYMPNCVIIDNDEESADLKLGHMQIGSMPIIRREKWIVKTYMGDSEDEELLECIEAIDNDL